jgi:cell division transport system permease protein
MPDRHIALSLSRDPVGRSLPWLIAFMAYLGALAVAGFLIVQQVTSGWERGVGGVVTVQLPPEGVAANGAVSGDVSRDVSRDVSAALGVLRATPGVARAEAVSEEQMRDLLSPWLGGTELADDLPLPRLIDVHLTPGARVDMNVLQERLNEVVPAALVDDHARSLAALRSLTTTIKAVSIAVIAAVAFAAMGTVFVVTLAEIGIHGETIEVLHLIGADDAFVARQFTIPVLKHALLGGIIGCAAAVASLLALERIAADLSSGTVFALSLVPLQWAALSAVPFVVAALTLITARVTVHRALAARA